MKWKTLESNPQVVDKYLAELGVSNFRVVDVLSFDESMLGMIDERAIAFLVLFPVRDIQAARLQQQDQLDIDPDDFVDRCFFMKQAVPNACGTVALVSDT